MPLAKTLPAAILETILTRLAPLFLTTISDLSEARQAATQMLAAYYPETEDELRLAANIIAFSFHALEALGQAAAPDLPLTRILRLRGSAVSLSRESAKAERRLDQIQKARRKGIPTQPQPEPNVEKALSVIEDTRSIAIAAKTTGQTWTQAEAHRQRENRIAASLQRAERKAAAYQNPTPIANGHDNLASV